MRPSNKEAPTDQAAGLRRLVSKEPIRVIAVSSGKGGVGKTNVSVNLALAIASQGKDVMLFDADLGLANVDVLLGLNPVRTLTHVLNGECSLEDIMITGPGGLKIIPASSGIKKMASLSPQEHAGVIRAFSDLGHALDVLVVDTAAGISESVTSFARACQEVIVVVCDEPASLTDAYALIKVLSRDHGQRRFRVLANMVRSQNEGQALYHKLARVTDRFLDVSLDYMGAVPFDDYLRKAVQKQRAVVDAYPGSRAAVAFKKLALQADKWPLNDADSGHLQFFFERLIQGPAAGICA
jgi:flagellar biosynthesis protein FlhG